jgi:ABC-2 type transport system permease protein
MNASVAIAAKDLRQRVRDRSAILMSIVAPFGLALLFAAMLGGGDEASFHTSYVVVNLDNGSLSKAIVDGPLTGLKNAGVADLTTVATEADARAQVDAKSVGAALIIPAGFSDAVQAGQPAKLVVVGRASAVLSAEVLRSVLNSFAGGVEGIQLTVATVIRASGGLPAGGTGPLVTEAMAQPDPVKVEQGATANRMAKSATYYAASMAVMFVFFAAQFGVMGLLTERRTGTLGRILASPITPRAVLLGKILVSITMAIVSMSVIVIGSTVLMGARWGDPLAVAALIFSVSIAASGIALLVVGFARTEDQAGGLVAIVALTLAVLGGSFFPMSQAPDTLNALSVITPHAWFLRGVNDLTAGGGIGVVLPSFSVLMTVGLVTGGIGLLRARRVVMG